MTSIKSIVTFCAFIIVTLTSGIASANSAVAIMYHRFGENEFPTTNIRVEQLDAHIEELSSGKYTVMRLIDVMNALQAGKTLPDRTVSITIDDAFASVYKSGWPKFEKAGLPITVFISAGPLDQGHPNYMSWDQLREMAHSPNVDVAGHGLNHGHLAALSEKEARHQIENDYQRIVEEIGETPLLFAYPYGEASASLMSMVKDTGYIAAFGQQSGAITTAHNQFYLPRFPVNERYGEMARFKMSLNAVGLAATDYLPKDPLLFKDHPQNPPAIGFTLPKSVTRSGQLACYHSQIGKVEDMQRIGSRRVELRFTEPFVEGRTRVNCTLPAGNGRWYWYGMQFYTK